MTQSPDTPRGLEELAGRCEQALHMSREIDAELEAIEGAQYSHPYTGYLDEAARLVPDDFVWCAGTAVDDDGSYCWANCHAVSDYPRIDCSTRGATPALALCAAILRVRSHIQGNG